MDPNQQPEQTPTPEPSVSTPVVQPEATVIAPQQSQVESAQPAAVTPPVQVAADQAQPQPVVPTPGVTPSVTPGTAAVPGPMPVSSQPFMNPQSGGLPKPKTGMIIGIVVAVLVLVGAGAVFGLGLLGGVSSKDYVAANTQMEELRNAYNDMRSVYISSSSTETEIKNAVEKMKTTKGKIDATFSEVGKTKAVSKDKELSDLYKKATDKKPAFDRALGAGLEAYEKILPPVAKFSSLVTSPTVADFTSLRTDMGAISGLQDDINKDFISKLVGLLQKAETLAAKVQEGRADYKKYDAQAYRDFLDTSREISNTVRDWQSNLTKLADEGELRDELSALNEAIFQKTLNK